MSTDPVAEYAEGLANLELGRTLLAVQDFFNVSESRDASPDLKARARLARGRTALLAGAELTAVSEWTTILDLPAVSPEILDEARHELLQVAGLTGTPHVALAPGEIFQHGQTNLAAANLPAAVAAFALVLEDPQSSRALRARVLADRGTAYLAAGAEDSAAADWNTVLASPSADAETRRKARTGLRRICLAAALRTTAIELNAGHLSFAIANYDSIFADGRLEEYEPYVAATMLLRLPEVPDELREQAARFVDRLRGRFGEPPTDIVAIPAIIVPSRFVTTVSKVAAGAEATCRFVGNRLPKTVREFSAHLVLGALAGAVLTGGVFLLFGILSVVLALDWLALIALPLIGVVLGAPFGAIIGVAVYLNPPNDQNSRRLSRRLRRGLIAALGASSYATFLLVAAWATSPPATVSIEGPMIFIGVFAAICGVWGVFTDS